MSIEREPNGQDPVRIDLDTAGETEGADGLVQFVKTRGTQVAGRFRDKTDRIAEAIWDLRSACEGAVSLGNRTPVAEQGQWFAALARACSVFLRKMVIRDWNDPSTRLLDENVLREFGMGFDRLKRVTATRRTLILVKEIARGEFEAQNLMKPLVSPKRQCRCRYLGTR